MSTIIQPGQRAIVYTRQEVTIVSPPAVASAATRLRDPATTSRPDPRAVDAYAVRAGLVELVTDRDALGELAWDSGLSVSPLAVVVVIPEPGQPEDLAAAWGDAGPAATAD